jgi:hypothetical protein
MDGPPELLAAVDGALNEAARQLRDEVTRAELLGPAGGEHFGWSFGRVYVEGVRGDPTGEMLPVRLTAYAEQSLFHQPLERSRMVLVSTSRG